MYNTHCLIYYFIIWESFFRKIFGIQRWIQYTRNLELGVIDDAAKEDTFSSLQLLIESSSTTVFFSSKNLLKKKLMIVFSSSVEEKGHCEQRYRTNHKKTSTNMI